eukprot:CAMPEP_0113526160 /NCGR_PEP_ID=MMETSP0015_2-20120614/589_1 /TAXON_ID=2838 /ORGANISM="Odontella" /LENGTH=498 /DNA_ID=CAMNT_0000424459 /DNA_START=369 /DNA_END=1865 /DNA_ORIENTATION=+ /assembly_acc=CAM_ASM_000160
MEGVASVTSSARGDDPQFRSMKMTRPPPIGGPVKPTPPYAKRDRFFGPASLKKPAFIGSNPSDEIDKDSFFKPEPKDDEIKISGAEVDERLPRSNWLLDDKVLRPVPTYYPLEKSSRFVTGASAKAIASKISECCRIMSVQAEYNHDAGTAALKTIEHVEIHIALWRGSGPKYPECVIVEAQRRRGDAVLYHKYCRSILDAADGDFDVEEFHASEEREKEHCKIAEKMLANQKHLKKPAKLGNKTIQPDHENSLLALEIAASLLKKDRMDARQLGMESLCLLTDPARTGIDTALIASRVVLTGSAQDESCDDDEFVPEELGIREAILSLVQFGRLAEDGGYMDELESDDEDAAHRHPEEQEHNNLLHNLALAVLANALDVLENHGSKIAAASGGGTSSASVADAFLSESKEISSRDLLSTLLSALGSAGSKPHDACLSARCLGSLCEASKDARRRSKEMNAKNVVATALDVGKRTHVKLETETEKVLTTLEKVDDEQE